MLLETLGVLMSVKENESVALPAIRHFSGTNKFSDSLGQVSDKHARRLYKAVSY